MTRTTKPAARRTPKTNTKTKTKSKSKRAADTAPDTATTAPDTASADADTDAVTGTTTATSGDPSLTLTEDGLRYRLDQAPTPTARKCVVSVQLTATDPGPPFVDRADLYSYRSRVALAQRISDVFARRADVVLGHLTLLLDQAERARAAAVTTPAQRAPTLTDERRQRAEALLRAPDLLGRAAAAMGALGYVGEEAAKRLLYLAATSRLLTKPLSVILIAPAGCGKSELLDVLTRLLPPEAVEFLSRVSPAALYYAGPDHLRHKVVVVDEQAGASEADYAVRTLQTKGLLRLAVPIQGRLTHFEARGPIALLSGTTRTDLNPENLSRCLELGLDVSPAQTRRIHQAQRLAWCGQQPAAPALQVFHDGQRLLERLEVVIPFAPQLDFPARVPKDRRDHPKLRGLIAAHALLHQRQRRRDGQGRVVAELADYRAVHPLVAGLLAARLDDLSPRAAALYRYLAEGSGRSLTRREAAELQGVSYNTAAQALRELSEQELARALPGQRPRRFALLDPALVGRALGLTPPEDLAAASTPAASKTKDPVKKPASPGRKRRRRRS